MFYLNKKTHANFRKPLGGILFGSAMLLLSACGGGGGGGGGNNLPSAPDAPDTTTLSFESVKLFRFDWTDVAGATHYQLLEDPDGSSGFSPVGDPVAQGTQTLALPVPLYDRTNASYILQACNAGGCTDGDAVFVSGTLQESIGYFKASNTEQEDRFGSSVSINHDGTTLVIGAPSEDSNATGINGDENDNTASDSGAVYVFTLEDITWHQQAYIKASNTDAFDGFGGTVSISDDGNTLAVGAKNESSNAAGINGDETDNSLLSAGAVYVFIRQGEQWEQQAYIKASNPGDSDDFGEAISLSGDGHTLAVGVQDEDSNARGINGDETDNSAVSSGAVYVFQRNGADWAQQAYIKSSNSETGDDFGEVVSLSADGNTLAVTADQEDSAATGINGDETNNDASGSGAAYVFVREGTNWSQQAYIKPSNTDNGDDYGESVSLSADGNTLAIGSEGEDSSSTGINGIEDDNSASSSGAVYVYTREGTLWQQQAYIKASNTDASDGFGETVSLSADGQMLVVGSDLENSNSVGLNGDEADNSFSAAGAVYVFVLEGNVWQQQTYVKASNTDVNDRFGQRVSLSGDGQTLAITAPNEDSDAIGIDGFQGNAVDINGVEIEDFSSGAVYLY